MITRIRHKGLRVLWRAGDRRGVPPQQAEKLMHMLRQLDNARGVEAMRQIGYRLHLLEPRERGRYAVSVTRNWRLVFRFEGEDATDVDLVDYH